MSWLTFARTAAIGASLTFVACGSGGTTPTSPTTPTTYPQKTESYNGSIAPGETKWFHFTVENPGSLDAAITSLSPVSTLTMGLYLGGWDATNEACSKSNIFSDGARLNLVLSGTPQAAGEYCVAIYDVGNLQSSSDFGLTVLHY